MTDIGEIPSITSYNIEMRKSLIDKIFFIDKIDADVIVDYGCADGAMIAFLEQIFPEKKYVGYDLSEEELQLARARTTLPLFYSDWSTVKSLVEDYKKQGLKVAVVCNSLIHEVYSYGSDADVDLFWSQVFDPIFDYFVIRDMSVSKSVTRLADSLSVLKVRQRFDQDKLHEFEVQWGRLDENWSLVHFLLKYRYQTNWKREVRENYLPLSYEDLISKIPPGWNPIFHEHFTLPFIRQQVQKDFNIDLQDRTHVKLILKRSKVDAIPTSV